MVVSTLVHEWLLPFGEHLWVGNAVSGTYILNWCLHRLHCQVEPFFVDSLSSFFSGIDG